jgi:hypothetical protein
LKRHMDEIGEAVEQVCHEQKAQPVEQMAERLMTTFLEIKMRDAKTSVALYSVSSDVDGAEIVQAATVRSNRAIVDMLKTAREQVNTNPQVVAAMLQSVMSGVSRRLLESSDSESQFHTLRQESAFLVGAYLKACSARLPSKAAGASR